MDHRNMRKSVMEWNSVNTAEFGKECLCISHRLHQSELFSDSMLAKLIEESPRQNYHVETMEPLKDGGFRRREGETGNLSGPEALRAVKNGRIWYQLLDPGEVDPRYDDLLNEIYDEIEAHVPGFQAFAHSRRFSVLVSSPNIEVGYHSDTSGQTLWQVRGSKRVYVYPAKTPFLKQPNLEKILLKEAHEVSLPFDPSFDEHALIYDLQPGQMLHWPLNAPHRVSNHDCLNVSFTTEHSNKDTRRSYIVNYANGILRGRLGLNPASQKTNGLAYWVKYGVAGAYRTSGLENQFRESFTVDFKVDPSGPGGIDSIPPYEFRK